VLSNNSKLPGKRNFKIEKMKKQIELLALLLIFTLPGCNGGRDGIIMTVTGPVPARSAGITLTHEHILVDFIGADSINSTRWNREDVMNKALPFLMKIKDHGCKTFIDCTPEYIGRDPELLRSLSEASGLNIITNTGYYGAANYKFIPRHAYSESADQLAARWISEWVNGIAGTGIKPGFIKTGVFGDSLSDFHRKLVTAAARTHLRTGLVIASHTGPARPAFEQLEILRKEGVAPDAFIWVHAQTEQDLRNHVKAGKMGAWISFDGLNEKNAGNYIKLIRNMKDNNLLDRVLLSHDAGWYDPAKPSGGGFRGYNALFETLVPLLKAGSFTTSEIKQLLVENPAKAFTVKVRMIK
jgi:phosphotriesterase-related protein